MPTIAWFYGIAIRMYVKDHPPPHVHAIYGEYEAFVAIDTGESTSGIAAKRCGAAGPRMGYRKAVTVARELAAG